MALWLFIAIIEKKEIDRERDCKGVRLESLFGLCLEVERRLARFYTHSAEIVSPQLPE